MSLYNWFGGETFICTITITTTDAVQHYVPYIYIYILVLLLLSLLPLLLPLLLLVHKPDRVVITFVEGCEMGRKNETARLKINTNNGRGNAPRLYTCTIPACVYMYYAHTYYIPTPPPHPRHKFWKIRPRTTATHDPLVRFIYRSGMQ